jgi:RHS repeat-associated protein
MAYGDGDGRFGALGTTGDGAEGRRDGSLMLFAGDRGPGRDDPMKRVQLLVVATVLLFTILATPAYARRLDGESGLMYYRARMYDTDIGRFIERDPIGYRGSPWNLYEYVNSSPVCFVDPLGLGANAPKDCSWDDSCGVLLAKLVWFDLDFDKRLEEWNEDKNDYKGTKRPSDYDWEQLWSHEALLAQRKASSLKCWAIFVIKCKCYPVSPPSPVDVPVPKVPPPPPGYKYPTPKPIGGPIIILPIPVLVPIPVPL